MKTYTKVATPERIPTNLSPSQIADRLNKILADLARQTNHAVDSLTGGLADSGVWFQGVRVRVRLDPDTIQGAPHSSLPYRDICVPHGLGRIPQEWIPADALVTVFTGAQGQTTIPEAQIWRSPTPWTSTTAFFRASENCWLAGMQYTIYLLA